MLGNADFERADISVLFWLNISVDAHSRLRESVII